MKTFGSLHLFPPGPIGTHDPVLRSTKADRIPPGTNCIHERGNPPSRHLDPGGNLHGPELECIPLGNKLQRLGITK